MLDLEITTRKYLCLKHEPKTAHSRHPLEGITALIQFDLPLVGHENLRKLHPQRALFQLRQISDSDEMTLSEQP